VVPTEVGAEPENELVGPMIPADAQYPHGFVIVCCNCGNLRKMKVFVRTECNCGHDWGDCCERWFR
jgi:hypothetical protein